MTPKAEIVTLLRAAFACVNADRALVQHQAAMVPANDARPLFCAECHLPTVPFGGEDICMGAGDCAEPDDDEGDAEGEFLADSWDDDPYAKDEMRGERFDLVSEDRP